MVTNIKNAGYMYLSSNSAPQTTSKSETNFADAMEKAGGQKNNSVKNTSKPKTDTETGVKKDSSVSKEEPKTEENASKKPEEAKDVKDSDKTKTDTETKTESNTQTEEVVEEVPEDASIAEDFAKAAENLIQFEIPKDIVVQVPDKTEEKVLNYVADKLETGIEDIQASMQKLQMNVSDLLDPQNLLKLIADVKELNGPEELLMVPQFTETFKELNIGLKDILNGQESQPDTEYTPDVKQETAFNSIQESLAASNQTSEGSSESGAEPDKHHTKADDGAHMQSFQNTNIDNTAALQPNVIGDKIQELLTERVDAQTSENIVKQVLEQVKLNIKTDVTSVQMQLYPEHLGKVAIQVVSKNGVLTAQIAAENEGARAALESQLTTLKESFDNQGLKVEAVEVMVSSRGFEQNADTNNNSENGQKQEKRVRKNLLQELEGEEETQEEDLKVTLGNTVSYTA